MHRHQHLSRACVLLLACLALASLGSAAANGAHDPAINAVIGDLSWIVRHGVAPGPDSDERTRIAVHLAYVERELRARPPAHLSREQRARRAALLDALARYRQAGVFPHNDRVPGRAPRFIDDAGRLCAVGYLVAVSSGLHAAQQLRARHEWQYVLDMHDATLEAWARANGFSVYELAMIQPAYDQTPAGAPPQAPPTRGAIVRRFTQLQGEVDACAQRTRAPVGTLIALHIDWPAKDPLRFDAESTPSADAFATCVAQAARNFWVRAFGNVVYTRGAETQVTLRFRASLPHR